MELEAAQRYGRQKIAIEDEMQAYRPEVDGTAELPLEDRFNALAARLEVLCTSEGREEETWDHSDPTDRFKKITTVTGYGQASFPESEEGARDDILLGLQITYEITRGRFFKVRKPIWLSTRWHQNRLCSSMPQECIGLSDLHRDEEESQRILGLIEGSVASAESALVSAAAARS